ECGEQPGERVCGTQEAGADLAPSDANLRPEVADAAIQRQQPSPGDRLGSEQWAERDETRDGGHTKHNESTTADEADLRLGRGAHRAVLCLTRLGTSFTNIRPGHPERGDRIPAQLASAVQVAASAGHSAIEGGAEGGTELAADHARALCQQRAQRAHDSER